MYVAISNDLIERVKSNILDMEVAELDAATPDFGREYPIDASELFNMASFGDHLSLLPQLPKSWFKQTKTGEIKIINADGTTYGARIRFTDLKKAWHRPAPDTIYGYQHVTELECNRVAALPDGTPGKAEFIQRAHDAKVRFDISTRWNKIKDDVIGFLRKCKSLNEAVKAVPTIKLYLHKDDIERLERKVERKPREKVVVDIDVDSLTASAVAARLQQAA